MATRMYLILQVEAAQARRAANHVLTGQLVWDRYKAFTPKVSFQRTSRVQPGRNGSIVYMDHVLVLGGDNIPLGSVVGSSSFSKWQKTYQFL